MDIADCIGNHRDRKPRMTMREVAKRAKVSIATVSRTINGAPNVSPYLARRVRRAIEEIGYFPNTHARALVCGRSRVFGLMISETINLFFPEIVRTFENLGFEHNFEIFLSSLARDPKRIEIGVRRMIERQVEGVVVLSFEEQDAAVEALRGQNLPVVGLDIGSPGRWLKSVGIDYKHGIRQAVQHLAALGHTRIALIAGPADLRTAVARKIAVQECMTEIGLEIPPQLLVEGGHTLETGMKALFLLAASTHPPSAVLCSHDMMAMGVMRGAFELGLDIPRDLSLVGCDDIHMAQFTTPPLTTVQISQAEIANTAFRALLDCASDQSNGSSRRACAIRTQLVLRHTTAPAPGRLRESASAGAGAVAPAADDLE